MNTAVASTPYGPCVAGLECGSAVISQEGTLMYRKYYPSSQNIWIAVTNHHVVKNSSQVMCNFHFSQVPFEAQVYKLNPNNDLALLKMEIPEHLLGDRKCADFLVKGSDKMTNVVGEKITLVGYPLGTECQTVSTGTIVSFNVVANNLVYENSALCNPGNSGGAMLDCNGDLLGINTAIMNPGSVITLSKPYSIVKALFTYIKHDVHPSFKVFGLAPAAEHDLRGRYKSLLHPEKVAAVWDLHDMGDGLTFGEWFMENAYGKQNHTLVADVLQRVHAKESPPNHNYDRAPEYGSDHVLFNGSFQVNPVVEGNVALQIAYPALENRSAVMISHTFAHETDLCRGDLLVGINNWDLDSYGNFRNGPLATLPYFVAFKHFPSSPVKLHIARQSEEKVKDIMYTYNRVDFAHPEFVPKIHSASLTPFEVHPAVPLGGLVVCQMGLEHAIQYEHKKYLMEEFHNELVFVVPAVHPASQEWLVQRISPGSLMTHINFKPLKEFGESDKDVWGWVKNEMVQKGKHHITVTFQCRGLDGTSKEVHNVYAVDNI